jgi:hypothetical protein
MIVPSGHSERHAMIEEEGARLVLEWWNKRVANSAIDAGP